MMFSVLFVISALFLFPFGDAAADNVVSKFNSLTVNAGDPTGVVNEYKVLATGTKQGDPQNGCNPSTVSVNITPVVPTGITADPTSRIYGSCNSFLPYTFRADRSMPAGDYAILVEATPVSATNGVYHTSPATFTLTVVVPVEIKIDSVEPNPQYWGVPVNIAGTASGFVSNDEVDVDCGDGTAVSNNNLIEPDTGGWTASCTYSNPGSYDIIAKLVSETDDIKTTATAPITIIERTTTLNLDPIDDSFVSTRFLVSGELIDNFGKGVNGRQVTFSNDGAQDLPIATTGSLEVNDGLGITIDQCSADGCPEYIMRLNQGAEINIGYKATLVKLLMKDMGSATFNVDVTRGDGTILSTSGSGNSYFIVGHESGISQIKITSVSSPDPVGISEIQTNSNSVNKTIRVITFGPSDATSGVTSLILADGVFASEGTPSSIVRPSPIDDTLWIVDANFSGDSLYAASQVDQETYATIESFGGVGGAPPSGDVELGITAVVCTADADNDALCDDWEGVGNGVPYTVGGQTLKYNLPGTDPNVRDLLYEVDYMNGHQMDAGAKADVIALFAAVNPTIILQFFEDQVLAHKDVINVWKDADTDKTNDYEGLKAANYGTAAEHPILSGTQANTPSGTTITVSGLKITTPAVATDGKIIIGVKLTTTSIPTSTSIPASVTLGTLTSGLTTSGATASVSSLSTTSKVLTIIIPFSSSGSLNAVNIPSASATLSLPLEASISSPVTNPGSPTSTTTLLDAKAQAIRYMLIGHSSGGRSGAAELKGNDISITLGVGFGETNSNHAGTEGTRQQQAGTIAHEVAHNLNLDHGAPAQLLGTTTSPLSRTDNCKPNHISIMNYARQLPTFLGANWVLEFGKPIFPNIKESALNESIGLKSSTSYAPTIVYGTPGKSPAVRTASSAPAGGANIAINWDADTSGAESSASGNINNLGITGCNTGTATAYQTTDFVTYDEAAHFDFNFRGATNGQFDGVNELTVGVINQQVIAGATYTFIPPPSEDGSETRKGGSTIQLKFDLTDPATGAPITTATAHAEYITKADETPIPIGDFTFNGNDGHYALQFQTPKIKGSSQLLYINYIVDNPDATPPFRLLVTDDGLDNGINPFIDYNEKPATIKLTLTK